MGIDKMKNIMLALLIGAGLFGSLNIFTHKIRDVLLRRWIPWCNSRQRSND